MITFFKNNKHNIWLFTRLAIISGLIFTLVMVVILSVLVWLYQDNVKESFLARINEGLQTEIFVDDLSVNIFRNFPSVSLTLQNVTMLESSEQKDTLLSAGQVYFRFSIFDLIRQNYTVKQIEIARANLDMKLFEDNTNNFTFWQSSDDTKTGNGEFNFQLQSVIFNQVQYDFTDLANHHKVGVLIHRARLKGDFNQAVYALEFNGDLYLDELIIDKIFMIGQRNLDLDIILNVYNNNKLEFSKGHITLGSHDLIAQGVIDFSGDNTLLDLNIFAEKLKFDDFVRDLPSNYAKYFEGYRSKGDFYFDASIRGAFSSGLNPGIDAKFGIHSGEMYHRKTKLRFEDIYIDAAFNNGYRHNTETSSLIISNLKAKLNKREVSGRGTLINLREPLLDFQLYSDIKPDHWVRVLQIDTITEVNGELLIDLEFRGKLGEKASFNAQNFMASRVKGTIRAEGMGFRLKDDPLDYNSIYADFLFNNNDVAINHFSGNASSSNFKMSGYFRNVIPWLFVENERLIVDASLKSQNINFNELLQHNVSENDTIYRLTLPDKIIFNLKADIDQLAFRKFEAGNVKGTISMHDQVFYASDVSFAAMKGHINVSGYINGQSAEHLVIGCDASFFDVDVHDLFYQMGNFGQEGIKDENLRGLITAQASFVSQWTPFLEIDWNSLETTANIKVENGELINYKPMVALSRFIRVGDLNQVKFSTLENQIRIKGQNIIIPDMEINSNAINIKLSGEHTFQNEIDYRLQVLLSDLLAGRNRQNRNPQEQYGDIIDDGLGRTTLFLAVGGTIDDPVFRYDRRGVREKLREDFRQERQNLREVFRREFASGSNGPVNDTVPNNLSQREKEQKEIRKREKGKFVIEWDED